MLPLCPPFLSLPGKGFLKELILRRDEGVLEVFAGFGANPNFLEEVNKLIGERLIPPFRRKSSPPEDYNTV